MGLIPDNGGIGTGYIYLRNGEQMHIAGGAYVYGAVNVLLKDSINISGRGILSGAKFNHDDELHGVGDKCIRQPYFATFLWVFTH